MPPTSSKLKKNFRISWILNIITSIGFIITIGAFVFTAGKKEARIEQLEKDVVHMKSEHKEFVKDAYEQKTVTTEVNAKLDLLLGHFNIISD